MDGGTDTRRITLYAPADFAPMREAGRLAALTLDMITPHVCPGVTTGELDRLCHEFITGHGAIPAPLNYRGFPMAQIRPLARRRGETAPTDTEFLPLPSSSAATG